MVLNSIVLIMPILIILSNAGGGGEKVLWCMVESLMKKYSQDELEIVIYTGIYY